MIDFVLLLLGKKPKNLSCFWRKMAWFLSAVFQITSEPSSFAEELMTNNRKPLQFFCGQLAKMHFAMHRTT